MLPTVVDLWPDCDLLVIDDGVTVVMVAEWDSRIVVDGVCVGHSQVLFLIRTVQLLELNEQLSLNLAKFMPARALAFEQNLHTNSPERIPLTSNDVHFAELGKFYDVFYLA